MPDIEAAFHLLTRTLEPGVEGDAQMMVELLLFPELATYANRERQARAAILDLAADFLKQHPLDEITRRLAASPPELARLRIMVEPARRSEAWRDGIEITLDAVVWDQGAHAVAMVPALPVTVIAPDRDRLPAMLADHALAAVKRDGWNSSLLRLAQLERGDVTLASLTWSPGLGAASDRWKKNSRPDGQPDAVALLTTPLEGPALPRAFHVGDQLAQLARLLTLTEKPSILLVGPAGAGKTALVQELARRRTQHGLAKNPFHRSSGARLVAGACGFGMWQQRCGELMALAADRSLVLHLGSLFELLNVGQSSGGSESIASFLRPFLVRREVQVIAECTPEQLALVERQDPRLTEAFRIMKVPEPPPEVADAILQTAAAALAGDQPRFTKAALHRTAALHRRYIGHAAFPGAPLRFIRRLHEKAGKDQLIEESDVHAAFSQETGMPRRLLDPAEPLDLPETQAWFEARIRGQQEAVEAIVTVIAQLKAGLTRPGRPLMSLLFTGPTGTGKTEMAKALAEFLFQSPERMIRLDMSEYGQAWSAQRLVSGSHDGREGILTAAVREQPFNVLLLDEFEKAAPEVFDLLLQVLGEARLTDAAGRTADFSNCVIIMTSNLGAQEFSRGRLGFNQAPGAWQDAAGHFAGAVQQALRPEMFNRIDRIVPYHPLTEEVITALARREITEAAQRPGFTSRSLRLEVTDALLHHLAGASHDPRYGARPLKRRIARELLAPLAAQLPPALPKHSVIHADLDGAGKVRLHITRPSMEDGRRTEELLLKDRLHAAAALRRTFERLRTSTMVHGLTGALRLTEMRRRAARGKNRRAAAGWTAHDAREQALKECLEAIENATRQQAAHEEALMLALYRGHMAAVPSTDPLRRHDTEELAIEAFTLWQPPPPVLVLVLQGQPGAGLLAFARMYRDLAQELGGTVKAGLYARDIPPRQLDGSRLRAFPEVPDGTGGQAALWRTDPGKINTLVLWITGGRAPLLLKGESGLHLSKGARGHEEEEDKSKVPVGRDGPPPPKDWQCRLEVHQPEKNLRDLAEFLLPLGTVSGQPDLESGPVRRQYDPVRRVVRDGPTGRREEGGFELGWLLGHLHKTLLEEALS